jgi:ribosomal protein S18 acetylase RimI-like enzyme
MKIKRASSQDKDELFEVYMLHFKYTLNLENIPKSDIISFNKIRKLEKIDFEKDFENSKKKFFIAISENKIVGFIKIYIKEHPYLKCRDSEIEDIFVLSQYRRMGIAKKLFNYAKRFAISNGAKNIFLGVNSNNLGAIKLYDKLGFIESFKRMKMKLS